MMTETEVEIVFDKGCSNLVPNHTLEAIMYENFRELGVPNFDEEEREFAHHIRSTLTVEDKKNMLPIRGGADFAEQLND